MAPDIGPAAVGHARGYCGSHRYLHPALEAKEPGLVTLPQWLIGYVRQLEKIPGTGRLGCRRPPPCRDRAVQVRGVVPNQHIVMEVFKGYWRPLPAFERMVWRIIPDPSTRKNEFLTGGIDLLPFVTPEIVPEIQANPNLRIETVLSTRLMFVGLPVDNPLLADKRVRLALNLAVNKQRDHRAILPGHRGRGADSPLAIDASGTQPETGRLSL